MQPNNPQPIDPNTNPSATYNMPPTTDPGQGLAIAGVVLAFIAPIIGLVLSIISRNKSRKAGHKGTLGLVGFIISIITTIISLLVIIAIALVAYQGIQERARQSAERYVTPQVNTQLESSAPIITTE